MTKKQIAGLIIGITGMINTNIVLFIVACILVAVSYYNYTLRYTIDEPCVMFSDDRRVLDNHEDASFPGGPLEINAEDYSKEQFGDIKKYLITLFPEKLDGGSAKIYSHVIFDTITEKDNVSEGSKAQIYLEWSALSKEAFTNEINSIGKRSDELLYSNDLFNYPCCVRYYNRFGLFTYCLFNESEYKIVYIAIYDVGKVENIVFDVKYIPKRCIYEVYHHYCETKNGFKAIHAYPLPY